MVFLVAEDVELSGEDLTLLMSVGSKRSYVLTVPIIYLGEALKLLKKVISVLQGG